eukprot:m.264235 g.264235  ORF g.264235 m.264235 type:complete len:480 (+) comp15610_c1_seq13:91-1530(+)
MKAFARLIATVCLALLVLACFVALTQYRRDDHGTAAWFAHNLPPALKSYQGKNKSGISAECDRGYWGPWSTCDLATCTETRSRLPTDPGDITKVSCKPLVKTRKCIDVVCGLDDVSSCSQVTEWSKWSSCNRDCGKGTQVRTRAVSPPGCAPLHNSRICEPHLSACPPVTCQDELALRYLDDTYFAKGYTKTVWRAQWAGENVVVKKPIGESETQRSMFLHGVRAECAHLESLSHLHIMRSRGCCLEIQNPFSVVEGDLLKFSWVSESKVSACLRMSMALQAIALGTYLSEQHLVHCDFKYDQTALTFDGVLKLVDLKSLYQFQENGLYLGGKACTTDADCKRCFKMMDMSQDHACLEQGGHCHGYDDSSMVFAIGNSVFQALFAAAPEETIPAFVKHRVAELQAQMTDQSPGSRPNYAMLRKALHAIIQEDKELSSRCSELVDHDILQQLTMEDQIALRHAYVKMVDSSAARCEKRYC